MCAHMSNTFILLFKEHVTVLPHTEAYSVTHLQSRLIQCNTYADGMT